MKFIFCLILIIAVVLADDSKPKKKVGGLSSDHATIQTNEIGFPARNILKNTRGTTGGSVKGAGGSENYEAFGTEHPYHHHNRRWEDRPHYHSGDWNIARGYEKGKSSYIDTNRNNTRGYQQGRPGYFDNNWNFGRGYGQGRVNYDNDWNNFRGYNQGRSYGVNRFPFSNSGVYEGTNVDVVSDKASTATQPESLAASGAAASAETSSPVIAGNTEATTTTATASSSTSATPETTAVTGAKDEPTTTPVEPPTSEPSAGTST